MLIYKCPKCGDSDELYGDHIINMQFSGDGDPNPSDFDFANVELFEGTRVKCYECTYSGPLDEFRVSTQHAILRDELAEDHAQINQRTGKEHE